MEGRLHVELIELYKELQLVRLKYDQVADVCRKLTKSWPNRGSDGRLIKEQETSTLTKDPEKQKPECTAELERTDNVATAPPEESDNPDLQMLANILKKAKGIKLLDEEPPNKSSVKASSRLCASENHKKAAKIYQPTRPKEKLSTTGVKSAKSSAHKATVSKSSKSHRVRGQHSVRVQTLTTPAKSESLNVRKVKNHSFSPTTHTLPAVTIVKHTARNGRNDRRPDNTTRHIKHERDDCTAPVSSASLPDSSVPHHTGSLGREREERKFDLLQDGSKLCMPSKYNTLRNTFFKVQEHIASLSPNPSTEAMREHFVQRLIPHEEEASPVALQLQLAKQEYQLLTEELDSLTPQVCGGVEVKDASRVKEKMDFIVGRSSALERELREKRIIDASVPNELRTEQEAVDMGGVCQQKTSNSRDCEVTVALPPTLQPMAYSSLSELLHLVEAEHRHRMLRIELQILKFCTEVVLPKYKLAHQRISTTEIQILSELAGKPKPIFICDNIH